jgi:hypothetical protein
VAVATDLQVVYPQNSISVRKVRLLTGYKPSSILVEGDDFGSVDEVWINETPSPNWTVLNPTTLVAQVPDLQAGRVLTSVEVLSNRLTIGPESLLRFRIGRGGGRVRGIMRLVQLYVKVLLTTPGTDIFSPQTGGGLLTKVDRHVSLHDGGKELIGDLIMCCGNATKQIIATQAKDPSIPPVERLLSANVENAVFDRHSMGVKANIQIISHSGVRGYANMML